jgi:hypothetical protein
VTDKTPPDLREFFDPNFALTPEEITELQGNARLVCGTKPVHMAQRNELFTALGLPPNVEGRCDACSTPIIYRPWAAIAKTKICGHCAVAMMEQSQGPTS